MHARNLRTNRYAPVAHAASLAATLILSPLLGPSAFAASDTWNGGGGDGSFTTPTNWVGGNVPGVADGTYVSTDVATINGGPPADLSVATLTPIAIATDTNRNIYGFDFDVIDTQPFAIGNAAGPALNLTGGGNTRMTANVLNNSTNFTPPAVINTILSPMVVHGNAYTFTANQIPDTTGLQPTGPLTFTGSGLSTITLDGSHRTGGNTSNDQLKSPLADGSGGTIGIVKTGTGTWEVAPAAVSNTYSGDTVVTGGWLRIRGVLDPSTGATIATGASPNSNYIVNTGARMRFSDSVTISSVVYSADHVIRSVTINSGGTLDVSNSTVNFKIANNSGPGLILNYTVASQPFTSKFLLTGTTPDQGGIKLNNGGVGIATVDLGATTTVLDLGSVRRPIDIAASTANTATYDLRIRGPIIGTGGILKIGPGTLRLDNNTSTFSGSLEVREGKLLINVSGALLGQPALTMSGGTFHVNGGHTHTFSSVTATKGMITASNQLSTILSPSYTFDVAVSETASIATVLGDSGGASTLTKNGLGTGVLTGTNTYTGATTINAGTLSLASFARAAFLNGSGYADIKGGRLNFDYTGGTSPLTTIVPILTANAPTLFAAGLVRSSNATATRGLGWIDDGVSSFTVAAAYNGDTNLDGAVTSTDFNTFVGQYGATSGAIWAQGDFDYDGKINTVDFNYLAGNFGATPLPGALPGASLGSVVPEPASLGVAVVAAAGMMLRRRRI